MMTHQEWHDYWHDYIKRYYQNPEDSEDPEPSDINSGATEKDIQILEKKYGIVFPASYRTFLQVTDGMVFYNTKELWSVKSAGLDRFKKVNTGIFECLRDEAFEELAEMKKNNWFCPEEFHQFCYNRTISGD